ncbi:MAG: hypothetical protein RLZ75_69, partial [Pseudomonadota bacterium]
MINKIEPLRLNKLKGQRIAIGLALTCGNRCNQAENHIQSHHQTWKKQTDDDKNQLRRLGCRLFATQHLYGNIGLTIKLLTKPTRLSVPLDFKP